MILHARDILTCCIVERESCVTNVIEKRGVCLIPIAKAVNPRGVGRKLGTYRLRFLQTALAIPSIFIAPMSPRASTSSMYLVMTCPEIRILFQVKAQKHYIDAEGYETGDFQLLEVDDLAFICGCFTLPWSSRFLEGVCSRGLCTLVA